MVKVAEVAVKQRAKEPPTEAGAPVAEDNPSPEVDDEPEVEVPMETSEQVEQEAFMNSPVTQAVLSGYACKDCGTPVKPEWAACPVCGGTQMVKSGVAPGYQGFGAAIAKHRKPPEAVVPPAKAATPKSEKKSAPAKK